MVITGRAKGSAFDIYRTTLDHFEEPKLSKMTFKLDGTRRQIKAEDVGESQLEPIKNPVTGKAHRVSIVLPAGGFESTRMDMASSKMLVVNDGYLEFKYEGTYGSIQKISWKGSGTLITVASRIGIFWLLLPSNLKAQPLSTPLNPSLALTSSLIKNIPRDANVISVFDAFNLWVN